MAPSCRRTTELERAQDRARREGKILMVLFGADWCPDCRRLSDQLSRTPVREYADHRFIRVRIDVGKFDRNIQIAKSLGVEIAQGIPTAGFFSPDGVLLMATNRGELGQASADGAEALLRFLEDVANLPSRRPSF